MTLRPCLDCGEPAAGPRCPEHTVDRKPPAAERGYDGAWTRLSKRARRLQPFCTDCGSTEDLQADHTPEAWARKAAGKAIRLQDIRVVCGPCNRAAGAARGPSATRGGTPSASAVDPLPRRDARYTPQWGMR
jgi:5-methylcytosine-specific restriction endonuclease McrA